MQNSIVAELSPWLKVCSLLIDDILQFQITHMSSSFIVSSFEFVIRGM
jgi:hypothetical protein